MKKILIIQGHPNYTEPHLCHGLAEAYQQGAKEGGHSVSVIDVASLNLPFLTSEKEFNSDTTLEAVKQAQIKILAADHLLFIFPLWMGDMPAVLKGFIEQTLRPNFAFQYTEKGLPIKKLKGKSASIIVTMGMPAIAYSWFYRAHSIKSLQRNILKFSGMNPVKYTLLGGVANASESRREAWLAAAHKAGQSAR